MFEKVAIIGVGLLGGSLALDLRRLGLAKRIIGVVNSSASADYIEQKNLVDELAPATEAVIDADLLILATPMQTMLPMLAQLTPELAENAIITDVGSVKTDLYRQLQSRCPQLLPQFVLAHPVAGGEQSGPQAAQSGLFAEKDWIVTPTNEVKQWCLDKVINLWQRLGANVVRMSVEQHDAVFAKTSHLPHVVAFSLVNFLSAQANRQQLFELAASGFYDFTRIASSNAQMWRDICVVNQQQVSSAIKGYIKELEKIVAAIDTADEDAILEHFAKAKIARDKGLLEKGQNRNTER